MECTFGNNAMHQHSSMKEAARRDDQLDRGGSESPNQALDLDQEEGNSLPLSPLNPEAEGRGRGDDRDAGTMEEEKIAQPQPERVLSRLQSNHLL